MKLLLSATLAFLAAAVAMIGAGLRPDQVPAPFMGTAFMGTDIFKALIAAACVCMVIGVYRLCTTPSENI